jgi:hypothetical protein
MWHEYFINYRYVGDVSTTWLPRWRAEEGADGVHVLGLLCPRRGSPKLERKYAAVEHDIDDVGQLNLPRCGPPQDPVDQGLHLFWLPPSNTLLLPGLEFLGRLG